MQAFHIMSAVRREQGFTLVELLIVVIILAILAGIVVPQFTASTQDAREASLDTTLANVRAAVDLYFQQHGEYPSFTGDGTNAVNTKEAFITQLSRYTDEDGVASATQDPNFPYGPYLRANVIPTEPITQSNALEVSTAGTLGMAATGGDPGGWKFDNKTGQFIVNDAAWDDR